MLRAGPFPRSPISPSLGKNCYSPRVTLNSHSLATGADWRVDDVVCTSGPHDAPFEEQHDAMCIAAVTEGTFQYRSESGSALLAPGSLLLGNQRQCFKCAHEYGVGDRCLSFHFTPEFLEAGLAGVVSASKVWFTVPSLPPLPSLIPVIAAAAAARDHQDGAEFEELSLRLAAACLASVAEIRPSSRSITGRDERRIADALRRVETDAEGQLALSDLAREAGMSAYHFLRTFRAVVGTTPYQFVLRTRLHRAAVRLRRSNESVAVIAFDAGFGDLSTFNRRFQRIMGLSPGAYRERNRVASRQSAI